MENLKTAVWIAHSLFERGKASGSSANMSFKEKDRIYITGSGTCFGTLKEEDFSVLTLDGEWISGPKPSKEFPLHKMMYEKARTSRLSFIHTAFTQPFGLVPYMKTAQTASPSTPLT